MRKTYIPKASGQSRTAEKYHRRSSKTGQKKPCQFSYTDPALVLVNEVTSNTLLSSVLYNSKLPCAALGLDSLPVGFWVAISVIKYNHGRIHTCLNPLFQVNIQWNHSLQHPLVFSFIDSSRIRAEECCRTPDYNLGNRKTTQTNTKSASSTFEASLNKILEAKWSFFFTVFFNRQMKIYLMQFMSWQMIMNVKMLLSLVESMPTAQTRKEVITVRVCMVSNQAMVNELSYLMMEPPAWVSC